MTHTTDTAPVTESKDWPAILARLEKIIALENAAGTQAEAEAAAAAMTRLLTRYNLSRADVSKRLDGQKGPAFEERHTKISSAAWCRVLFSGIARANFCRPLYAGPTAYCIGDPANVAAVIGLYDRIRREVERLTGLAWANLAPEERPAPRRRYRSYYQWHEQHDRADATAAREWKGDFRYGCVAGVVAAIREARDQAVQEVENGSALVVVREAGLNDEVRRRYPHTGKIDTGRHLSQRGAYESGRVAGAGIRVHDQLG